MLIAIDHGNKQIKTVHTQPFTSGLIQGDTPGFGTPGFGTDCLTYQGKYYTLHAGGWAASHLFDSLQHRIPNGNAGTAAPGNRRNCTWRDGRTQFVSRLAVCP